MLSAILGWQRWMMLLVTLMMRLTLARWTWAIRRVLWEGLLCSGLVLLTTACFFRWDFDTAEEYGDYMGTKEAMPKAAFQYGMKMSDGRKTKGKIGAKNEKAKLDKEWNKISALIDKRKTGGGGGGASKKQRYDYE